MATFGLSSQLSALDRVQNQLATFRELACAKYISSSRTWSYPKLQAQPICPSRVEHLVRTEISRRPRRSFNITHNKHCFERGLLAALGFRGPLIIYGLLKSA